MGPKKRTRYNDSIHCFFLASPTGEIHFFSSIFTTFKELPPGRTILNSSAAIGSARGYQLKLLLTFENIRSAFNVSKKSNKFQTTVKLAIFEDLEFSKNNTECVHSPPPLFVNALLGSLESILENDISAHYLRQYLEKVYATESMEFLDTVQKFQVR